MSAPRFIYRDSGTPGISPRGLPRAGGYQAFEKALKTMTPAEVTETVKASRLVGRGGAGFPTGLKWELVAREPLTPKFVVANADEGEPGTFKDLPILTRIPHRLIEGMLIGAYAVGAEEGVIVCRGEFMNRSHPAAAIAEARRGCRRADPRTDFFRVWVPHRRRLHRGEDPL
jgi:NADH:ubiquinone oxidoreductase subunit F (NADH-binding)